MALKADVGRAAEVGHKLFPADAAALIADLIRRDLPYYDAAISREFVVGMNQFARDVGILHGNPPYRKNRGDPIRRSLGWLAPSATGMQRVRAGR